MRPNAKTWVKRLSQERPNNLGHLGYSYLVTPTKISNCGHDSCTLRTIVSITAKDDTLIPLDKPPTKQGSLILQKRLEPRTSSMNCCFTE